MADINQLYGDAKATARSAGADRKQKQLEAAKQAFETNPTADTKTALATAYFDNGNYVKALELLSELVKEHAEDIQVLCDLGFTYKKMNQLDAAKDTFHKVVSLNPRHALARCAENELWTIDPTYRPSWLRG
jgi:intraflagellar transport protein 88